MSVSAKTIAARQARHDRKMAEAEKVVPTGYYCYEHTGRSVVRDHIRGPEGKPIKVSPYNVPELHACPYLKYRGDWPEQMNGYCRLLKAGDNTQNLKVRDKVGFQMLWDAIKGCDVNRTGDPWGPFAEEDDNPEGAG